MDEIKLTDEFIALSRFAGSRFDLVQAGGGNASVKLDGTRMLVKASGFLLSELEPGKGYALVDYPAIASILDARSQWHDDDKHKRDANVARLVRARTTPSDARASIEVFLHAVLGRHVLHTHPLAVNVIASQSGWEQEFAAIHPDSLSVCYRSPGIELGMELAAGVKAFVAGRGQLPRVIFLQNHGLIVSADTGPEARALTEEVVAQCARRGGVDFERYAKVTAIAEYVGDGSIAYLCEDRVVTDLLEQQHALFLRRPFFPDSFVFCSVVPLVLDDLDDAAMLASYRSAYHDTPKVIIHDRRLYFLARNIKKAKEIEEVFKAHLLALASMRGEVQFLDDAELAYLGNWEAEKYRKER